LHFPPSLCGGNKVVTQTITFIRRRRGARPHNKVAKWQIYIKKMAVLMHVDYHFKF
jgi:hypothetical protein